MKKRGIKTGAAALLAGLLLLSVLGIGCDGGPTGGEEKPLLRIVPPSLDFGGGENESLLTSQNIEVVNAGGRELTWQASSQQEWISLSPAGGTVTGEGERVTVTIDRSRLQPGTHAGSVEVTSNGGDLSLQVTASVPLTAVSVSAAEIDFGIDLDFFDVLITSKGGGGLVWVFDHDLEWLQVAPSRGTLGSASVSVRFTVQRRGLAAGSHEGEVRLFTSSVSAPVSELTVRVQVGDRPVLTLFPDRLDFGRKGDLLTLEVENMGNGALAWQAESDATWIELPESNGQLAAWEQAVIEVRANRDELEAGLHQGQIWFTSNGGEMEVPVWVEMASPAKPEKELVVTFSGSDYSLEDVEMEFVWIPPGRFAMGSPPSEIGRDRDEGPVHEVTISSGFYLGRYEITQEQWETVMDTTPWIGRPYTRTGRLYPAVFISWTDVEEFIDRLNEIEERTVYRLPTEAEWEYACRAGTDTPWSFGEEGGLGEHAWYLENTMQAEEAYAHQVGTLAFNPWGLYDMHGNVWEWCRDRYGDYSGESLVDPTGALSGPLRVMRGGGFSDLPQGIRSAHRTGEVPDDRYVSLGARLVRIP